MIEPLIILAAGVAAWLAGAVWYGLLGNKWVAALGTTKAALARAPGLPSAVPFILVFVADVVLAWVLALVLHATFATGIGNAVAWAMVLWMGFVLTTIAGNYSFARRQPMLTLIDSGHWLFAMIAAAVVLGALG